MGFSCGEPDASREVWLLVVERGRRAPADQVVEIESGASHDLAEIIKRGLCAVIPEVVE